MLVREIYVVKYSNVFLWLIQIGWIFSLLREVRFIKPAFKSMLLLVDYHSLVTVEFNIIIDYYFL